MKQIVISFLACIIACTNISAQTILGISAGFSDSGPAPNINGYGYIGYNFKMGANAGVKSILGYTQTIIPSKTIGDKTVFSGALVKVAPEFVLTPDRYNPFRFNIGAAFYGGKNYLKKTVYLPGGSFGLSWGFNVNDHNYEIVGDIVSLFGKDNIGSFSSKMHLMSFIGFATRFGKTKKYSE